MEFAWDERKASASAKKHHVSFHEAARSSGIPWRFPSMTPNIRRASIAFLPLDCLAQVVFWLFHTPIEAKRHGLSARVV